MRLIITSSSAKKTFGSVEMTPNRPHNVFSPSWGNQRILRCVKDIHSASDHDQSSSSSSRSNLGCKHDRDCDTDADQRSPKKAKTKSDEEEGIETAREVKSDVLKKGHEKPLNMRTRRSAGKETTVKRAEFSLVLSNKEIDEDFWKIMGRKAPRYPKKRPKTVQNDLDKCLPGTYFEEVRLDKYIV